MSFKKFVYLLLTIFALLGAVFIPFSFQYLVFQTDITQWLFQDITVCIAERLLHISVLNPEISSDSATLYVLMIVLLVLALVIAICFTCIPILKRDYAKIVSVVSLCLTYYLATVMLKYGLDKVFKVQFYLPEPNILYTPLGLLDKDILYWSTMGASYSYNVFSGLIEVIPALLLVWRKTRMLGLLALWGVLLHVLFINIGFDISVKLFAGFLLLVCSLLLWPNIRPLFRFLVLQKQTRLTIISGKNIFHQTTWRYVLKIGMLLFIFCETLLPYIKRGNFNDDQAARPYLHGAYEVMAQDLQEDNTMLPMRIFIHRQNFFIFQFSDGNMEDYALQIDSVQHVFTLTNYDGAKVKLNYQLSADGQKLILENTDANIYLKAMALPWRDLPLLQPLFHWSVDGVLLK